MPSPRLDQKHPSRDFTSITQLGLKTLNLALTHKAVIEPRLPKNALVSLQADLIGLAPARSSALQVRSDVQVSTTEHMATLEQAHVRVMSIRKALRSAYAPVEVQRGYGVGSRVRKTVSSQVEAAAKQILDRVEKYPAEPESFGILAEDLDALKAALAVVTSAGFTQELKRAKAPDATKERNRMANRILRTALQIGAAGMVAFVARHELWVEFAAIKAGASSSKKGAGEEKARGEAAAAEPQGVMPKVEPRNDNGG